MPQTASVIADLPLWGPNATHRQSFTLSDAEEYCRRLAQSHYENFPVATWLLPRQLRQHFYNVYAFCRWADDLGDETGDPERSLQLLAWWREQLQRCYQAISGNLAKGTAEGGSAAATLTPHPVFVALQPTIERFGIPLQPFDDLITAFEQDQRVREYATFAQLVDYCTRSANPVGRIVLYLCERFSEENAQYADSICTGLQLANFWQDVARDADIGRIYLPKEDRERFGYSDDDFRNRITNEAFVNLMEFEVVWARQFLMAGFPLVGRMPGRIQVDIELFIRGGLAILKGIEGIEFRVWERRPTVSKWDVLFAGALCLLGYVRRCIGGSGR